MLRSSVVLFAAIISIFVLKKRLYRHHWTSMFLIIVGIFMVGISSSSDSDTTSIVGIVILLIGEFFGALGYVLEEKFFGEYDEIDPFLMMGYEGLW